MNYKKLIGERIKEARVSRGIDQATMAKALSVSITSVSQWENGHTYPKLDNLVAIAELTNYEMPFFFTEQNTDCTQKRVSESQQLLMDTYNSLNDAGKAHFLTYASVIREANKFRN